MTTYLYLAEIEYYDPDTKAVSTLRYASGQGHITTPSETPASTLYDARIKQAVNVPRHLFADGKLSGRSRVTYGDLVLQNADGLLDPLLGYAMAGRPVTIRRGTPGAAYPSGFTTLFVGTVEQAEAQGDTLLVKMRDKQADLLVPLQTNQYGGTNALPDGLDGVADDLAGKRKPLCFGQVYNAPIPCVNTARLIYQVSDGLVDSVDAVYDAGVPLLAGFPMTVRDAGYSAGTTVTACAYGADLFVVVTDTGLLATSPDGITWTARTSGFGSSVIYDVVYANGMFVACGQSGKVATSVDGRTWTLRSTVLSGATLRKLAYGKGYWVVISTSGGVASSPDAVTWTTGDTGFAGQNAFSLAFGNGRFVIGGAEGRYASSIDGLTWTDSGVRRPQIPGFESVAVYTISYGGGLFIAGGQQGAIATSPDGIYWSDRSGVFDTPLESISATYYGAIASGTGSIYLVAGTSGSVATSEDGITWTKVTSGVGVAAIYGLVFGDGRFIAVGVDGLVASTGASQTYATIDDLMDDMQEPVPGTYGAYYGTSGSYVRLGASPYGQITADITQGATAADRTAGQLFAAVLTRSGKVSGDWSASDVTALDTATSSAVCGDWIYGDDTVADVLDRIAASAGAWWGPDRTGVYRLQQLTAPAGTPVYTVTANDAQQPLARLAITDDTKGLPPWRSIVRYQRNFAVQVGAGGGSVGTGNGNLAAGAGGQDLQTNTAVLATGSTTPRQLADRFAEVVNVMDYGATADGVTDDTTAVTLAAAVAGTSPGAILVFPPGTYAITSDVTLNAYITVRFSAGAKLLISTGVTVTIQGPMDVPPTVIFSGAGVVSFLGNNTLLHGYPQWWGATGDGFTDDTSAVQSALTALAARTLLLPDDAQYAVTATLALPSRTQIIGHGYNSGFKFVPTANDDVFISVATNADNVLVRNFFVSASGSATGKRGIEATDCSRFTAEHIFFSGFNDYCIHRDSGLYDSIADCRFLTTHNATDTGAAILADTYWNRAAVTRCRFQDNDRDIRVNTLGRAITIVGCSFELTGSQASSFSHSVQLENVRGAYIAGCYFEANRTSATQGSIFLQNSCRAVRITGCSFDGDRSGTTYSEYFVWCSDSTRNVEVSNCWMAEVLTGFVRYNHPSITVSNLFLVDGGSTIEDRRTNLPYAADIGDADLTLVATDAETVRYETTLTANRIVTLPSGSSSIEGQRFRIVRPAGGAFKISVRTSTLAVLKVLWAAEWCEVRRIGSEYILTDYGPLNGGDFDASGGFAHTADGWYQDNVAASQTNVELTRATGRWTAVRGGSVLGVVVHSSEARTAGTLTVDVYKNTGLADAAGSSIGLTAVLDGTNTSRKATTQAKDTDTFVAGDELYAVVTTDGSWTPTTADIRVSILVEC